MKKPRNTPRLPRYKNQPPISAPTLALKRLNPIIKIVTASDTPESESCYYTLLSQTSCLLLPCGDGKDQPQCHTQQCGKKHAERGWQDECDRTRRIPEQRNRPLENKVPLHIPIQVRKDRPDGYRRIQRRKATVILNDMSVGNLVESHENRLENEVHATDTQKATNDSPVIQIER